MGSIAIVAIPSQGDPVWKISSEKVPHLTLLFLGDSLQNQDSVASYLEHVVRTTMRPFGLAVKRRGPLGPNEADVLFFADYNIKMLNDVRSFLLKEPSIKTAYESSPQFDTYTPHLTLGYPSKPAKEDPEVREISWVNFDRIALWTGDYTGPEFVLEDESMDLMMVDKGREFLEHFGVKGMRWGVRQSKTDRMHKTGSADFRSASDAGQKAKKQGVHTLSNAELQSLITRMNLEKQYASVAPVSRRTRVTRAGAKFAADVLVGVGKQQVTKLASDQATKLIAQAFAK